MLLPRQTKCPHVLAGSHVGRTTAFALDSRPKLDPYVVDPMIALDPRGQLTLVMNSMGHERAVDVCFGAIYRRSTFSPCHGLRSFTLF